MHHSTATALQLRKPLLVLNLGRGDGETDTQHFVVACACPCRNLPKARRGDRDTDTLEPPTQSSRFAAGQRPISHQQVK